MRAKEALKLHDEDEVIIKKTGQSAHICGTPYKILDVPRLEVILPLIVAGGEGGTWLELPHFEVK